MAVELLLLLLLFMFANFYYSPLIWSPDEFMSYERFRWLSLLFAFFTFYKDQYSDLSIRPAPPEIVKLKSNNLGITWKMEEKNKG